MPKLHRIWRLAGVVCCFFWKYENRRLWLEHKGWLDNMFRFNNPPADGDSVVFVFFFLSGSIFPLRLSPRSHSRQTNTSTATTTKIVIGNAASAGLGSCLQDYNMICEHVNTSWIKRCSLHAQEEPDGTRVSLKGAVNKRKWITQLFTLDHGLTLIVPTKSSPMYF